MNGWEDRHCEIGRALPFPWHMVLDFVQNLEKWERKDTNIVNLE
jgi:hypothetical protein